MPQPPDTRLKLPDAPASETGAVKAWSEPVEMLTYTPAAAEEHPMFLDQRVYQGSSGKVYPLPVVDRIESEPAMKPWDALHIENEFVRLMVLPGIGGRIHVGFDKVNGYDFFYRQNVIKPALVGLAGPWISGGVEFNWPQHHRPATYMPVDTEIERGADGSVTLWCSDHDPITHMKGMHGVCLRPGSNVVELKVRLFNRTPYTQTFLWWANVAARVHEKYQSFFPTDVRFVADHAKRAVTSFPLSDGHYYGVNYGERGRTGVPASETPRMFVPGGEYAANDLSWYANIPVPTSYMITGTREDFFGGYDHAAQSGFVHVANHHVSPGKKQWTWGNHEFGYAWDRLLTEEDGPYIELMAGVYTDNQPDFSYLAPWETKTFTQNWYPIHGIGTPQRANTDAAVSLRVTDGRVRVGVAATHDAGDAVVAVRAGERLLFEKSVKLNASAPVLIDEALPSDVDAARVAVSVKAGEREVIAYDPAAVAPATSPSVAVEPAAPVEIESIEELYLTGLHLAQYRHATRKPELYWQEALRRDPNESRVLNAMGLWHLQRGEFAEAEDHFSRAVARLTRLNPNPRDGEPLYNKGLALRFLGRHGEAYDAFYKATWNAAWRGPAYFALAEDDVRRGEFATAKDHLQRSLLGEGDNLNALNLLAYVTEQLGDGNAAMAISDKVRSLDPLDVAVRWSDGEVPQRGQEMLDLAFDLLRSGRVEEVRALLSKADGNWTDGSLPIIELVKWEVDGGNRIAPQFNREQLRYCSPHRLEELALLDDVIAHDGAHASAHALRGTLLYSKGRYEDGVDAWERASELGADDAVLWRNLGIAYFNVRHDAEKALAAFDRSLAIDPQAARVLYERDQLWKRLGFDPAKRLAELEAHRELVDTRDDLSVEMATLLNQTGRHADALKILTTREFQPWEGGEGMTLSQFVRAETAVARAAITNRDEDGAVEALNSALNPPQNLNETWHLLANKSEVFYWMGEAQSDSTVAEQWWKRAAESRGDFQMMAVQRVSNMTFWSAMALEKLGRHDEAVAVFREIEDYAGELEQTAPKIDYFATSLPTMLLFEDDLKLRNEVAAKALRAQAMFGLGRRDEAAALAREVLQLDPNHAGMAELLGMAPDAPAGGSMPLTSHPEEP